MTSLPMSDPRNDRRGFEPTVLNRSVIAIPLLTMMAKDEELRAADPDRPPELHDVVIDINLEYPGTRDAVRRLALELVDHAIAGGPSADGENVNLPKSEFSRQYLFARLSGDSIRALVRRNGSRGPIFRI